MIRIDDYEELKTKIVNFVIASQSINEVKDVDVTQGTATGTLMVALDITSPSVTGNL